jgi:Skp family chaperone for outer membrane proteins
MNRWIMTLGLMGLTAFHMEAKEKSTKNNCGFVNSNTCLTNSLRGKKEREFLEKQSIEMEKLLKDLEAQLNDTNKKRVDQDYLDALSPQAIEELNLTYQHQIDEIKKAQSAYYQVMQQSQNRMINVIVGDIKKACERVAKERHLDSISDSSSAFFTSAEIDLTEQVIREMDSIFKEESN